MPNRLRSSFANGVCVRRENGLELADGAKRHFPALNIVIISGRDSLPLPPDVHFLRKPWQPLDLLREAMR